MAHDDNVVVLRTQYAGDPLLKLAGVVALRLRLEAAKRYYEEALGRLTPEERETVLSFLMASGRNLGLSPEE